MRSFIVVGDTPAFFNFLESFCKKHGIPTYNRHVYKDVVKISHVREIKKTLASYSSLPRVVALCGEITIPAQNALLKSVEEADEQTFFVFSVRGRHDLLPTILSRCSVVDLGVNMSEDDELAKLFEMWLENPCHQNALLLSDYLSSGSLGKEFVKLLSNRLYPTFDKGGKKEKVSELANNILRDYSLVEKNNLNEKLFWDNVIFEVSE